MINDREEARDMVNLVFLKFWEGNISLETEVDFGGLLFTMLRNTCIDHLRRKDTLQRFHEEQALYDEPTQSMDLGPEDTLVLLLEKILREINKLPSGCRDIFKLSYLEGLTNQEIAGKLSIRGKTVRNQLTKARKGLRAIFRDESPGTKKRLIFLLG